MPDFYFLEGNISEFFRKLGIFTVLRPSEHNSNFYFSFQPVAPSPNLVSNSIENEEKEGREGEEEEKEEAEGSEKERDDDDGDDDDDNGDGDGHGGGDGHGDDDDDSDSEPIQKVDGGFSSMMRSFPLLKQDTVPTDPYLLTTHQPFSYRCMSKNVVASNQERSERNSERRNSLVLFEDVIPPRPPSPPTQPHSPSSPSPSSSSSSTPVLSQAPPLLPDSPLSLGPPRQKSRQRISGSSSVPSLTACPPSPLPPALSFAISGANQESPPRSASPPARFPYSSYFFPSLSAKSSPSPSLSPSPPSLSPSPSPSRSLRDSLKGEVRIQNKSLLNKQTNSFFFSKKKNRPLSSHFISSKRRSQKSRLSIVFEFADWMNWVKKSGTLFLMMRVCFFLSLLPVPILFILFSREIENLSTTCFETHFFWWCGA